jgi:tetratricopeptide (TPR) repeat protein
MRSVVAAALAIWVACFAGRPCEARGETAQERADKARARAYFDRGKGLYDVGRFDEALKEFAAGYAIVPKPQFLLNLGQCYRQLGDPEHALEMYKKFLGDAPPDDPDRAGVEQVVTELEPQAQAARAARAAKNEPQPAPPSNNSMVQPATTAPAVDANTATQKPAKKSFIKRHWWIIPVSLVAAAGLTVGIYFAARPNPCSSASIACVEVP